MTLRAIILVALLAASCATTMPNATYYGSYYDGLDVSLYGLAFEEQLSVIISANVSSVSYNGLWTAFGKTDTHWASCPGTVHDIYSTKCWQYGTEQCGNYKQEGDCYNREHSWPKSWWGGEQSNKYAYTDLHHIYPSDGYVNGRRGNLPFGEVQPGTERYVSSNGCRLGKCLLEKNMTIDCFEPAAYLRGDLARTYFYMSTRYLHEFNCCREYGVNGPSIRTWMEKQLRDWSLEDEVSEDEIKRNDIIFNEIQHNRNPYVDHPEWVLRIRDF